MIGLSGTLRGQQIANEREGNTMSNIKPPPLPVPNRENYAGHRRIFESYDADHMQAYAIQAVTEVLAERQGEAVSAQPDWRKCEFCGCNTNAKVRACCDRGRDADKAPAQQQLSEEQTKFIKFLNGEAAWDGYWFGDERPDVPGQFWWRKDMRRLFPAHGIGSEK